MAEMTEERLAEIAETFKEPPTFVPPPQPSRALVLELLGHVQALKETNMRLWNDAMERKESYHAELAAANARIAELEAMDAEWQRRVATLNSHGERADLIAERNRATTENAALQRQLDDLRGRGDSG